MDLMFLSFDNYLDNYKPSIEKYLFDKYLVDDKGCSLINCGLIRTKYEDEFCKTEKIRIFDNLFSCNGTILDFDSIKEQIDSNKCKGYFFHLCGELVGSADIAVYGEFIYLMNFGIVDGFRGVGIGKLFLKSLIDDAIKEFGDRYDGIHLTVRDGNFVAKSLYNSFGFIQKL